MKRDFRRRGLRLELLECRSMLAADCQPLVFDASESFAAVASAIDRPDEKRDYCFTLSGSGRLTLDMRAGANSPIDSFMQLFASDEKDGAAANRLVLLSDNSAEDPHAAHLSLHATAGTYRIQASAASGSETSGGFTLSVRLESAEAPYAPMAIEGGAGSVETAQFNDDNRDGQVNHKDNLDLVVASDGSSLVEVFLGLGDGTFVRQTPAIPYRIVDQAGFITLGDFDGDAVTDFVVGGLSSRTVTVFTGNGDGTFTKGDASLSVLSEPRHMAAADMNGDGCDDLAVPTESNGLQVFLSKPKAGMRCTLTLGISAAETLRAPPDQMPTEDDSQDSNTQVPFDTRGVAIRKVGDEFLIAATSRNANTVYTWLTHGSASGAPTFEFKQAIPSCADGTFTVVLEQFNQGADDYWDFATVSDKNGTVSVALAKREGEYQDVTDCAGASAIQTYRVGKDSEVIIAADFNRDDITDLATQNEDTYDVSVLLGNSDGQGNGDGTFRPHIATSISTKTDDIAAGDFDKDGNLDLAVATREQGVIVLFGLGDGSFVRERPVSVGEDPQAIVYGDFNRDNAIDVAVANAGSNEVSVLLGRGDGTFEPQRIFSLDEELADSTKCSSEGAKEGLYPRAIVVDDFNRDGRLDLATANARSDNASIFLGQGTGDFRLWKHLRTGESPWSLVAGDFNADGLVDLATANRGTDSATVLFGSANDCFIGASIEVGAFPERIVVAPSSHSRPTQLGTVNRLSQDVSWWSVIPALPSNINEQRFSEVQTAAEFPEQFPVTYPYDVPGWQVESRAVIDDGDDTGQRKERFAPRFIVTGYLNNDQALDLVVADDTVHELSVFLGYGDGTFQPALRIPTSPDPEFVAVKDINGDEILDLVTANDGEDLIGVFLGKGDGTFEKEFIIEDPKGMDGIIKSPEDLVIADLVGDETDKTVDLVVANDSVGTLSILTGSMKDGRLDFTPAVVAGIGANAGLVVGDFWGDPADDLAVMDRTEQVIRILARKDDVLTEVDSYKLCETGNPIAAAPKYLAASNLNDEEDDALDIVAADLAQNRVWIIWSPRKSSPDQASVAHTCVDSKQLGNVESWNPGTSTSTEAETTNYSGAGDSSIRQVALADFNGDSHEDIAVIQENDGSVWILLGNGKQSFLENVVDPTMNNRIRVPAGDEPKTLVAGLFDGDKHFDLVVGNRGSHDLSVLLGIGDGTFQAPITIAGRPELPPSLFVDINGDSRRDRVAVDEPNNALRVEIAIGADVRAPDLTEATSGVEPVVVDLNGDGVVDVVTVSARGDVLVRFGRGGDDLGTFDPPQFVAEQDGESSATNANVRDAVAVTGESGAWFLATADKIASKDSDTVSLYSFDVSGKPTLLQKVGVGAGPWRLASADVNGDGRGDLVVVNRLNQTASVLIQQNITREQSKNGAKLFHEPRSHQRIDIGTAGSDVMLADVMGSDLVDLVMSDPTSGTIRIWQGNGDGTFETALPVQADADLFGVSAGALRSRLGTSNIAIGNLGGDGKSDIVAANPGVKRLSLLLGASSGVPSLSSLPESLSATVSTPGQIVFSRLNNDDIDDLAILYPDSKEVGVRFGTAGGVWDDNEVRYKVGNRPIALAVGDVDRDQIIDLLVSNEFGDLLVLLGNRGGTFETYRRADSDVRVAVADLDGDGQEDVVFANSASDEVCVNDDNHCYGTDGKALAPSTPSVADLNQDGFPDLIVPNRGSNDILVFLGASNGTLSEAKSFQVGAQPTFVKVIDVTDDDIPDLVVANEGSNDVTVLKGVGRGDSWTLQDGPRVDAKSGPIHIQTHDVWGDNRVPDGVADLVVTNSRANSVLIIPGRGDGYFASLPIDQIELSTGEHPIESLLIENSLVTINRDSNTFTQFEIVETKWAKKSELSTGGQRPVRGIVNDFTDDGRLDLGIMHEDGSLNVFALGSGGFELTRTFESQVNIDVSDFALIRRSDGFDVIGVGNGKSQLVPLVQFRRTSVVSEVVARIGQFALEIVQFAAAGVLPGAEVAIVVGRPALTTIVDIATEFIFDGIQLTITVNGGEIAASTESTDGSSVFLLPDEEELRRAIADVGQQIVSDSLRVADADTEDGSLSADASDAVDGSDSPVVADDKGEEGNVNRDDSNPAEVSEPILSAQDRTHPQFVEQQQYVPAQDPAQVPLEETPREGQGTVRFDETRRLERPLEQDQRSHLSRWLVGLLIAGLAAVGLNAARTQLIRRHTHCDTIP